MNKYTERIYNGIWKENPTLVQMLGLCPTLAVSTSAINGVGMGLSSTVVLVLANILISALRHIIPDRVRLPAEIVVVASFVTLVDMLMEGFTPALYESLGIYAMKNGPVESAFDGIGMGLGFTIALTILGAIRELLGAGSVFGVKVMPAAFTPISIFILAPGAFFVIAVLTALQNKMKAPSATNVREDGMTGDSMAVIGFAKKHDNTAA